MTKNEKMEYIATLALIRAIPDMSIGNIRNGRLKSIYSRLQTAVDLKLKQFGRLSDSDILGIRSRVFRFGKASGWERNEKDVALLLSFVLGLIEDAPHSYPDRIVKELNNAFEFVSRPDIDDPDISDVESAIGAWKQTKEREMA